jgi:uncharacterized protein (TIGR00730 family)
MRICVYCSSSAAVDDIYFQAAREVGRLIGERGHSLIYGGSDVGLMGAVARAAHDAGARVVGVLPDSIARHVGASPVADEMTITATMAERKALMEAGADAFLALPGGFGTLEELFQVLTLRQLGEMQAAVALLNVAGFYDHLLAHLDFVYGSRFARPEYRSLYLVATKPEEALAYVEGYRPGAMPDKWYR